MKQRGEKVNISKAGRSGPSEIKYKGGCVKLKNVHHGGKKTLTNEKATRPRLQRSGAGEKKLA